MRTPRHGSDMPSVTLDEASAVHLPEGVLEQIDLIEIESTDSLEIKVIRNKTRLKVMVEFDIPIKAIVWVTSGGAGFAIVKFLADRAG